jgi:DnaJ domain
MFDRNRVDSLEHGTTTVAMTLSEGDEIVGKLTIPVGRPVFEFFNGPHAYVEFEPFDGDKRYVAKTSIRAVRVVQVPRPANLQQRLRDLDGFDPYGVLGVPRGASYDEIRTAYIGLAKVYHPDRYTSAELPEEVVSYLEGMARRINAAWSVLDDLLSDKRRYQKLRQQAVYTSQGRT